MRGGSPGASSTLSRNRLSASTLEHVDFGLQVREPGELNIELFLVGANSFGHFPNPPTQFVHESAEPFVLPTFSRQRLLQFRNGSHLGHVNSSVANRVPL